MTRQPRMLAAILFASFFPVTSFCQSVLPPQTEKAGPPRFAVTVNGRCGFIDRDGSIVIKPVFEQVYPFTEGLAAVQQQGLWGFIDTEGRMVIEPRFIMVGMFSDDRALFRDKKFTDPWGYIDRSGKVVIAPQFDCAQDFKKGIAKVGFQTLASKLQSSIADVGITCSDRFIDRNGKFVPEPSPLHFASGDPKELIPFDKDNLSGYLNAKGEIAIKPQFRSAAAFSDGLACVSREGLLGYINTKGEWVISPQFEYANDFSEGLAGVSLGSAGWGFIDRTGKQVIPARFAWVSNGFRHGLAEVVVNGETGYINTQGDWVWKPSK